MLDVTPLQNSIMLFSRAALLGELRDVWLNGIVDLVDWYNGSTPPLDAGEKAEVLERLIYLVGEWITDRPPKNSPGNQARWLAMKSLLENISVEAGSLGLKYLSGPADWKTVKGQGNRSYWLEYLDPQHRPGFVLSGLFEAWVSRAPNMWTKQQSFWDYVGVHHPSINPPRFRSMKVKYLAGKQKALKRRAAFDLNSKLSSLHPTSLGPLSTKGLETVPSGKGWGIFVVDFENNLYIHHHKEGKFHHSTFLSGGPVRSAGEIVVDDGVVKVVTAKSGHYMPTVEDMKRFLQIFRLVPDAAIIRPDMLDEVGGGKPVFYRVEDFRRNGVGVVATPLRRVAVLAAVPQWAQSPEAMVTINKLV